MVDDVYEKKNDILMENLDLVKKWYFNDVKCKINESDKKLKWFYPNQAL